MTQAKTKAATPAPTKSAPLNFTSYFKEEKDIYLQNVSNGQVSLQFGRGDDAMSFTMIRKRDPINLTNHIPFKKIAESTDFRKMLSRNPPILKIMTEAEYQEYYSVKSKVDKISVDEAIARAESTRSGYKEAAVAPPKTTAPADDDTAAKTAAVEEQEIINPRVIHLIHQATSKEIPEAERTSPTQLLQDLKDLEGELKFDDLEYIQAHVATKTIKTWAMGRQKEITASKAS